MNHRYCRALAAALLAAALIGCASGPSREVADLPGTDACFRAQTVFNWVVLDSSSMIVNAPTDRSPYLVKLMGPVAGLGGHERLGFQSGPGRGDMFCGGTASVVVFGPIRRREAVIAVRQLTPPEARSLIERAGQPAVHREPSTRP